MHSTSRILTQKHYYEFNSLVFLGLTFPSMPTVPESAPPQVITLRFSGFLICLFVFSTISVVLATPGQVLCIIFLALDFSGFFLTDETGVRGFKVEHIHLLTLHESCAVSMSHRCLLCFSAQNALCPLLSALIWESLSCQLQALFGGKGNAYPWLGSPPKLSGMKFFSKKGLSLCLYLFICSLFISARSHRHLLYSETVVAFAFKNFQAGSCGHSRLAEAEMSWSAGATRSFRLLPPTVCTDGKLEASPSIGDAGVPGSVLTVVLHTHPAPLL